MILQLYYITGCYVSRKEMTSLFYTVHIIHAADLVIAVANDSGIGFVSTAFMHRQFVISQLSKLVTNQHYQDSIEQHSVILSLELIIYENNICNIAAILIIGYVFQ